jgi:hypothetical protein
VVRLLAQEPLKDFPGPVAPGLELGMAVVEAADYLQLAELPVKQPDSLLLWAFVFVHQQILM